MSAFTRELKSGLVWLPELGMGRFPVSKDRPYDESYFARYQKMADTPMGQALTKARIQLVARHYNGPVLDVGIGAGQFVEARPDTRGYDVNPTGIEWLKRRGLWADLYGERYAALTFWDSLEHIDCPDIAVGRAEKWVFVSVPVFESGDHVLRSRHFRRDEHIYYWTHDGLLRWFDEQGFDCCEQNTRESELGRDGIGSFAFHRRGS
ncbi:methyltransferase domain-containing protein [Yokenella regensburgei]|uniref:methyltransferase domain-containing protein n=1 Tax=Yokenella regensburgei TaxID=158877 RepID=UPI0013756A52|nr:methyltransferase domain-containing protein [Yokenella regensburgei]KAF1368733.1 hypothetical protein FHR25_002483 [Yokenella regensburgei]